MSDLLDKPFLTTEEVAIVLCTNASTIRASRSSGMLYGRPAPIAKIINPRKIVYSSAVIKEWMDDIPDSRITTNPEPEHLAEAREG